MIQDEQGFKAIAIEYLYEGFELSDNIYNYNKKVLLVKAGENITTQQIEKLRNFNSNNRNIYVSKNTYQQLTTMSAISKSMGQAEIEDRSGYRKLKEAVGTIFRMRKQSQQVDEKTVQVVIQDISKSLNSCQHSIIFQCIDAPRPMDEFLQRHSLNVSFLNGLMGEWLGLSDADVDMLLLIGLLHDVGKTEIPVEILDSPNKLTPEEFSIIKKHPIYSYQLLCLNNTYDERILLGVKQHHEKITGGGYPDNLMGDDITLFARITAIADIYDAMISKRTYKEAHSPLWVLSQFAKTEFEGLDQKLVSLFVKNMPRQLYNKQVLMSDGTIGTIRYLIPSDMDNPIIDVDGTVRQSDKNWHCVRLVS